MVLIMLDAPVLLGAIRWAQRAKTGLAVGVHACGRAAGTPSHQAHLLQITLLLPRRLWNYRAKAPARGVQEAEVYVDEQLVWKVRAARISA